MLYLLFTLCDYRNWFALRVELYYELLLSTLMDIPLNNTFGTSIKDGKDVDPSVLCWDDSMS